MAVILEPENFGQLTIIIQLSQLLIPVFTLNFIAIISREIYQNYFTVFRGYQILLSHLRVLIIIFLFLFVVFNQSNLLFILYFLSESLFLVVTTFTRFRDKIYIFLILNILKSLIICCLVFYSKIFTADFESLSPIFFTLTFANLFPLIFRFKKNKVFFNPKFFKLKTGLKYLLDNKHLFLFALSLIPHIFFQWIIVASDKYVIKFFLGEIELGIYSISFSFAASFMLVNGALSLGIVKYCVQDYERFISRAFFLKYLLYVAIAWNTFLVGQYFLISFNFPENEIEILSVSFILMTGLYQLSFYYYFSSILFYRRLSFRITIATIITGLWSIFGYIFLIPILGTVGAAIAQCSSYFIYLLCSALQLQDKEFFKRFLVILILILINFIIFVLVFPLVTK